MNIARNEHLAVLARQHVAELPVLTNVSAGQDRWWQRVGLYAGFCTGVSPR